MKEIKLTNSAEKDLKNLRDSLAKNILTKLKEFSTNPQKSDVKKLKDRLGRYRLRIGDYRIVFEESNDSITVIMIAHRKDIYRRLKNK